MAAHCNQHFEQISKMQPCISVHHVPVKSLTSENPQQAPPAVSSCAPFQCKRVQKMDALRQTFKLEGCGTTHPPLPLGSRWLLGTVVGYTKKLGETTASF